MAMFLADQIYLMFAITGPISEVSGWVESHLDHTGKAVFEEA